MIHLSWLGVLAKESFGKIRLHLIRFLNELSVILPRKTIFVLIISTILTYGLSDSIIEDCERKMRNWRNW
ncbi:hypothetical protein [Microcystis sp.]|uniref:hypothetical protein n=1 Tax=Microcystis sp. TaxID=1127 RepID=UPI00391F4D4B